MTRDIELLVLAGGFGTRLRPAVADVPKPMAPVAGHPYVQYLIEAWVAQGVRRMTFLLHHQASLIQEFLGSASVRDSLDGCELRTLVEPTPLGTGGAVAYAVRQFQLSGSFLVANADSWLGTGVQELARSSPPSLAVVQVPDSSRYGSIVVEEDRIAAFREKSAEALAGLINAGLYHLPAAMFEGGDGKSFSLERDIFPQAAATGRLQAVRLQTDFIDIGIPADYFRFCRWIQSGKSEPL